MFCCGRGCNKRPILIALIEAAFVLGATALIAWSHSDAPPARESAPEERAGVPGDAFPEATPESQGVPSEAVEQLGAVVEGYVDKEYAVGAELLVIKNRRTIFHRVYGDADREADKAWEFGTLCNIRSMTKPITGVAAQMLIERGQLRLQDPVAKYLPAFDTDDSREITVEQVLTHRSGLPLTVLERVDQFPDLQAQVAAAGEHGPEFEPGSKFWYSDIGTDTVAAIVEQITGETIDAFVTREILTPLSMNDTFYGIDESDARFARVASLYVGSGGAWARFWTPNNGPLYPFAWGSQTLYSSPTDYAKLLAMWMDAGRVGDGSILTAESVQRILTPVSPMSMLGSDERLPTGFRGLETWYGQMSVLHCPAGDVPGDPVVIGHSGSDGTIAWAWPDLDLMVLYFTQSRGGMTVLRLEDHIDDLLIHPGEARAAASETPAALAEYVGTYIADFGPFDNERFEVVAKEGGLALDVPSQMVFDLLEPNDAGHWAFAIAPEQISIRFLRDDAGVIDGLEMHQGSAAFVVPREGTPLAAEQVAESDVPDAIKRPLVGVYTTDDGESFEILLEEGGLNMRAPGNIVVQLRPRDGGASWQVRQQATVTITFEAGEGPAASMTLHNGGHSVIARRNTEGEETDADH